MSRRMQAWLDAAASCGLDVMETSDSSGLKAWVGRLEVRIEPSENDRQRTRIVVVIPGPGDFIVVRIRAESGELPQDEEIEIGDAPFDRRFLIKGPKRQVLALLDAWTRRLLLRASGECRFAIHTGSLHAEVADEQVPRVLPLLLDLGRRVTESLKMDVLQRLVENVKQDPEIGVRLQNLLLLIREDPEDPATLACLEELGQSQDAAAAEPLLILALEYDGMNIQATAVSALGRVGTAAAVLPLMEVAEHSWLDRGLRRAARQAIEEIQSRLPDASPGQLSLAQTEAGQLSLATEQAGQLSLSDDEGEP